MPILIDEVNGRFSAKLAGEHDLQAVGATQVEAVAALTLEIEERIRRGELGVIDIAPKGVLGLVGKYADDESLEQLRDEVYAQRDAQRDAI